MTLVKKCSLSSRLRRRQSVHGQLPVAGRKNNWYKALNAAIDCSIQYRGTSNAAHQRFGLPNATVVTSPARIDSGAANISRGQGRVIGDRGEHQGDQAGRATIHTSIADHSRKLNAF